MVANSLSLSAIDSQLKQSPHLLFYVHLKRSMFIILIAFSEIFWRLVRVRWKIEKRSFREQAWGGGEGRIENQLYLSPQSFPRGCFPKCCPILLNSYFSYLDATVAFDLYFLSIIRVNIPFRYYRNISCFYLLTEVSALQPCLLVI